MRIVVADEKAELVEIDTEHGRALRTHIRANAGIRAVNHIRAALMNSCDSGAVDADLTRVDLKRRGRR
jgi:hypothetical protein